MRKRRLSGLKSDALVIVKMDIAVNHLVCLRKRGRFVPVFEDGEKVFCHRVVMRVSSPFYRWSF